MEPPEEPPSLGERAWTVLSCLPQVAGLAVLLVVAHRPLRERYLHPVLPFSTAWLTVPLAASLLYQWIGWRLRRLGLSLHALLTLGACSGVGVAVGIRGGLQSAVLLVVLLPVPLGLILTAADSGRFGLRETRTGGPVTGFVAGVLGWGALLWFAWIAFR